ncbi:MAG TPA: hypothetical protein EYM38_04465 [Dehalococcoidia bacterium]|nr:hypothetical protein [Dehalococcoidia bacterium]
MSVYWKAVKLGQNLILSEDNGGDEKILGGYRDTKRGIDAYATTGGGYDPGRSMKDFGSIEDAKAFVEHFRPWELFGAHDVTVDPDVKPIATAG